MREVKSLNDIPTSADHDVVCLITPSVGREEIFPLLEQYYPKILSREEENLFHHTFHMLPKEYGQSEFSYEWSWPFDFYESPYFVPSEYHFVKEQERLGVSHAEEINWNDKQKGW